MRKILVRLAINAVALWIAALVVTGITIQRGSSTGATVLTVLLVAVVFSLVNTFVKPIVNLMTLPLFLLTLGLITFVINAFMLLLTSWVSTHTGLAFHVEGFGAALLGALVVSFVGFILNVLIPD